MTITVHYPIGNKVYKAEAEINNSGNFIKKVETAEEIAELGNTDEAFELCKKITGGRGRISRQLR